MASTLSLAQLATLVLRKLEGGMSTPASNKYDIREVIIHVRGAIAKMINTQYKNTKQVNSDWLKPFYAKEKFDKIRQQVYIPLPVPVMSLDNDIGIYHVSLPASPDAPYTISRNGAQDVFSNLEAGNPGNGRYICYPESDRIYVIGKNKMDCTRVLLKLVTNSIETSVDVPVAYPAEMQADIIQLAFEAALYKNQMQKEVVDYNANTK